jgi:hypothetical protein
MNITEEALDEIEADAKYGAYVAPGTAVELIEEIRSLRADNADLIEALEAAEPMMLECMYIGGVTEAGADCMAKVRAAIARARGEK